MRATQIALARMRVGSNAKFIPDVNIALLRTAGLSAHEARFHVPLWFSKLDLRDYLWHVYGVEIYTVRSYVKQSRVQSGRPGLIRPQINRWHRPRANKFMTVQLKKPFVWPEEPDNYTEWNLKEATMTEKWTIDSQKSVGSLKDTIVNDERRDRMREQAKALLEGKKAWKPVREPMNVQFTRRQ